MAVKEDKLSAFFKSFADADEKLDFRMAYETVGENVETFSTGSIALDEALSSGGIPEGRLIQYYGRPGSGKSLLAMIAIANAQKKDPKAQQMFIDAEQTFDANWAESLGIDTKRLIIVDGDTAVNGRKCFTMLLGIPKEDAKHILVGKSKEGFLDKILKKEFNVNLIVLDSLGAVQAPGEDTSVVGKSNMALMARFLPPTFRKLSLELSRAKVPMIIINHVKDTFDQYGPDHTYSGGKAYSHFLSMNIYFDPIQRKDAGIFDDNEDKIGGAIRATVEKTKFGPWPRKCEFKIEFAKGVVETHLEIAKLATDYSIIENPKGNTFTYGDYRWVGAGQISDGISENEELKKELILKIKEYRSNKLESERKKQQDIKAKIFEDDISDDEQLGPSLNEVEETEEDSEEKPKKSKKVKQ